MGRNVTPTVEGGLLVAIIVILGVVTVYVPLVGMFAEFFFAVPVAVLTVRQGAGKGCSALFVSLILLSILISPLLAIRLVLSCGVCEEKFRRGKNFLDDAYNSLCRAGFDACIVAGSYGREFYRHANSNVARIVQ